MTMRVFRQRDYTSNLEARSMPGTRKSYEVSFKLRAVAVAESKSKEAVTHVPVHVFLVNK